MEKYFEYLNTLRDSGIINMFGAIPYLQEAFPELRYDRQRALSILTAWMNNFRKAEKEEGETPW